MSTEELTSDLEPEDVTPDEDAEAVALLRAVVTPTVQRCSCGIPFTMTEDQVTLHIAHGHQIVAMRSPEEAALEAVLAKMERLAAELAHTRLVNKILTRPMRISTMLEGGKAARVQSWLINLFMRALAAEIKATSPEEAPNNLSWNIVSHEPDSFVAGISITRNGAKSPSEQRDEARAELAALREAVQHGAEAGLWLPDVSTEEALNRAVEEMAHNNAGKARLAAALGFEAESEEANRWKWLLLEVHRLKERTARLEWTSARLEWTGDWKLNLVCGKVTTPILRVYPPFQELQFPRWAIEIAGLDKNRCVPEAVPLKDGQAVAQAVSAYVASLDLPCFCPPFPGADHG